MNLVQRIFENQKEDRERAFVIVAYSIATTSTKSKRMETFHDLVDLVEKEAKVLSKVKTGNIFCSCGNSIAPEDNNQLCDDCLELQP